MAMNGDERTADSADAFLRGLGKQGGEAGDDGPAEVAENAAGREYRRRYLVLNADPDEPVPLAEYKTFEPFGGLRQIVYLQLVESELLKDIGDGLIERINGLGRLAKLRIGYLWGTRLGSEHGEAKLWALKKPDAWVEWALGSPVNARAFDLFVVLNSEVARRAQVTYWQAQAMVHTALFCAEIRNSRVSIKPAGFFAQNHIAARYGPWNDGLKAITKALAIAEQGTLPLFEEEGAE